MSHFAALQQMAAATADVQAQKVPVWRLIR